MKAAEILPALEDRVEDLARTLLPGGRRVGREWDCRSSASPIGSVSVVLSGAKRGRVGFWQGRPDKPSETGGDLLHLIMAVEGKSLPDAISWARDYLGLGREDPEERRRRQERVEARRRERALLEARDKETKAERARRLWLQAAPRLKGTVAESYFAARGIPLAELAPHLEASLRFHPRLEWWMGAEYRHEGFRRVKLRPGPSFPAVLAAIVDVNGVQTGVHCTFLAPDGSAKADVDRPKLMFGSVEGGVIRLTKGAGLTPEEAKAAGVAGPLGLAEGIENGLTLALAGGERTWAATSLANLARAPVWHPCVSGVVVARDNDAGNSQAEHQFERAIAALEGHGKPVAVLETVNAAGDVNDLLRG